MWGDAFYRSPATTIHALAKDFANPVQGGHGDADCHERNNSLWRYMVGSSWVQREQAPLQWPALKIFLAFPCCSIDND
jgi:hypothetical protein